MRLFRWFIVRRVVHEPLRSGLTALGIALGVAVVVAIQLTNASSLAGFETALNTVSGRTSLEILSAGGGVDELRLPELGWLRAYGEVAPVIEGDLVFRQPGHPTEVLRLLGIDVLRDQPFRDYNLLEWGDASGRDSARDNTRNREISAPEFLGLLLDPASAIVAARFAQPLGLGVGSTLLVTVGDRRLPLKIRGLLKDDGPARVLDGRFVLMDIAAAQQALERYGRVDRIEIRLANETNIDTAESEIAARLPPGSPCNGRRSAAARLNGCSPPFIST